MMIPKEFAINGSIWKVEYKWNLTYNKKPVDGLCDPTNRIVFIDRSLSKEDKFWTFVHEFIHAVLEVNELGHNSGRISTDDEEELIESLESELKSNFSIKWRKNR